MCRSHSAWGTSLQQPGQTKPAPQLNHARELQLLWYLSNPSGGFSTDCYFMHITPPHSQAVLLNRDRWHLVGRESLAGYAVPCILGHLTSPVPQTAPLPSHFPMRPRGSVCLLFDNPWKAGGSLPRWPAFIFWQQGQAPCGK